MVCTTLASHRRETRFLSIPKIGTRQALGILYLKISEFKFVKSVFGLN